MPKVLRNYINITLLFLSCFDTRLIGNG